MTAFGMYYDGSGGRGNAATKKLSGISQMLTASNMSTPTAISAASDTDLPTVWPSTGGFSSP